MDDDPDDRAAQLLQNERGQKKLHASYPARGDVVEVCVHPKFQEWNVDRLIMICTDIHKGCYLSGRHPETGEELTTRLVTDGTGNEKIVWKHRYDLMSGRHSEWIVSHNR